MVFVLDRIGISLKVRAQRFGNLGRATRGGTAVSKPRSAVEPALGSAPEAEIRSGAVVVPRVHKTFLAADRVKIRLAVELNRREWARRFGKRAAANKDALKPLETSFSLVTWRCAASWRTTCGCFLCWRPKEE
jgi:hypothetical protein